MRVMLADDAVLFREGVARVLVDSGFEVVGQTGDGESILDLVTADPPDVVIIDMVRLYPLAAHVRRAFPRVRLVLDMDDLLSVRYARMLKNRKQGAISGTLGPGLRLACIKFLWQIIEQFARQLR